MIRSSKRATIPNRLLVAACFIFLIGCFPGCTGKRALSQKTVVNVNGQELSAGLFADMLAKKLRHFDALSAKDPRVVTRAKNEIIRDFIINVLTEGWAKSNGVFVRKEDLDAEVKAVRQTYPDELTFQKVLSDSNLDFKQWQSQITKSLLHKLVVKKLKERLPTPSDEELKAHYENNKDLFERPEQVRIRQIVLATEADAKAILAELKSGKTIQQLAPKHSITPEGKKTSGDLGWVEKGVMEGFDAAFGMKIGQQSALVKSPYGYHIFEVTGKRPSTTLPFDQVKAKIRQQLIANREQALYSSWLEEELRKARILKDEELISKIHVETRGE